MRLQVDTSERVAVVDVTDDVADAVPDGFERGVCVAAVPHTTAGVTVNEHEARLVADLERLLGRLVPRGDDYTHDAIDDNADAHLRAILVGTSVTVPVADGELALGPWQSVLFVEGDGPRTRGLELTFLPAGTT
jgi:secondary thiamine-phosphate synthase enzyme